MFSIPLISRPKLKRTTSRLLLKIDLVKLRNPKVPRNLVLVSWSISPSPFRKSLNTSLGYPNFVLSDALSELPLLEETKGANVVDSEVTIPQLRLAKDRFGLNICRVIADSGLDSAKVLSFVINDLKAKPYIARNLRREKDLAVTSLNFLVRFFKMTFNILLFLVYYFF